MPIDAYRMKLIFLNFDLSTKPTAGHLNIAVLGSVRYSFSQLRPPRLLSAQIHSLTPQIMPSGPLREGGGLAVYFIQTKSAIAEKLPCRTG